jgi:hypothetical protein
VATVHDSKSPAAIKIPEEYGYAFVTQQFGHVAVSCFHNCGCSEQSNGFDAGRIQRRDKILCGIVQAESIDGTAEEQQVNMLLNRN